MTEMANQIKVGEVYCSQKQSTNSSAKCQFNIETEWSKVEVANHFIFDNCFTIEILNDRQLYPVMQTTIIFSNMAILRERDKSCMCELPASVRLSTNNEAVSLVTSKTVIFPPRCWEI